MNNFEEKAITAVEWIDASTYQTRVVAWGLKAIVYALLHIADRIDHAGRK